MATEVQPNFSLTANQEATLGTALAVGMGLLGVVSSSWREFVIGDMVNDAAHRGRVSNFDTLLVRFWGPSVRREAMDLTKVALRGHRRQQQLASIAGGGSH